jgi:hypothetical protein
MRIGVSVKCVVCGQNKCPRGRSAPLGAYLCDSETCPGYAQEPRAGDLWPGETEGDFGYPIHGSDGTREMNDTEIALWAEAQ